MKELFFVFRFLFLQGISNNKGHPCEIYQSLRTKSPLLRLQPRAQASPRPFVSSTMKHRGVGGEFNLDGKQVRSFNPGLACSLPTGVSDGAPSCTSERSCFIVIPTDSPRWEISENLGEVCVASVNCLCHPSEKSKKVLSSVPTFSQLFSKCRAFLSRWKIRIHCYQVG